MKTRERETRPPGLHDPASEHDACGVGMVININGRKSHDIVEQGLQVLENMQHRGAGGADDQTGDGAGILVQVPHEFILLQGVPLPERGRYGTGLVFLPREEGEQARYLDLVRGVLAEHALELTRVRDVPVNSHLLGTAARAAEPAIKQLFVTGRASDDELERALYAARKHVERRAGEAGDPKACYLSSLSTRTLVYKGMLSSSQLRHYFPDLSDPCFTSAIALVHSRFSTNTFPAWELAQPFRLLGHNGEINTIRGNRSWMQAHESVLHPAGPGTMSDLSPIIQPHASDSASLDNALEFFVMSGMSLPAALAMLIPESRNDKNPISPDLKAFFEYHGIWMAPWDGPATLLFSDGRYAGGMLDRNGLRPARYLVTTDGVMVVASETGVADVPPGRVREKGRLCPGKMLIVDTLEGKILRDAEIKAALAARHPYREWLDKNRVILDEVRSGRKVENAVANHGRLLRAFGYTREDVLDILLPMARDAGEPISSMGNDCPPAALSTRPRGLFDYFRQQFAQVTNPPIDPIREELVMSLEGYIGAVEGNVLEPSPERCKGLRVTGPVLSNGEIDILRNLRYKGFNTITLPTVYEVEEGARGIEKAAGRVCREAEEAVDAGCNYIILSDRGVDARHAPLPSLLALSATHDYLVSKRKRTQVALIVETGEAREVMHVALLVGYGASAVNPYLAFAVLQDLVDCRELQLDYRTAAKRYVRAVNKGMLKIMSKMGISTLRGYRGARVFEALGLSSSLLDAYFAGTSSKIEGADLEDIARDVARLHADGFAPGEEPPGDPRQLEASGIHAYRKGGEAHAWNPAVIKALQAATRTGDYASYKEYARLVDEKEEPIFLRDLTRVVRRRPVPLEEVEPVGEIARRFVTGAMSFGAISREAHEIMAIVMNEIGGKSNTGEGGEDPARDRPREDGSSARSAIRQVASGRFGVTTEYLVNADEIQIKVAQGAKPGEGGQLPGYKVDEMIARTRHSIPGISLISPPPHHDIYSIEDLAQLIFDLKNVNPRARISVKLVSEGGVGTIAAGVAKAKADMILVSGCEGGTGASPLGSIQHAGMPVELGIAETQQTLLLHDLRGQVVLQADGQFKTGRDIIIAALLGAEEFGFATSALIAMGCVMARKCHLNTCPVGVATQDEKLRGRFKGTREQLARFFRFLAEDTREHLAAMGFRRLEEIVGRVDLLEQAPAKRDDKIAKIDLSRLLYRPGGSEGRPARHVPGPRPAIENAIDRALIDLLTPVGRPARVEMPIKNTDRATGAMLAGEMTARHGAAGLPDETLRVTFTGSAGQSFGAFLCPGITFTLAGDANDYLAKSLSGGRVIVKPPTDSIFAPEENVIAGNTLLYGATSGEVFINGRVGERFCVRNSGATAVVEGVGDHCCEYMTGGCTVVLGPTGRNFAAGMSGGIAYVWNPEGNFDYFCNMEMVELSLVEERADDEELRALVATHHRYTGSPLAGRMLANWQEHVTRFIKVTPIEYKKVLEQRKLEALDRKIINIERDY